MSNLFLKIFKQSCGVFLFCFLLLYLPQKIVIIIFLHLYTSLAAVSTFQGAAVALLPPFAHQQLYYYE